MSEAKQDHISKLIRLLSFYPEWTIEQDMWGRDKGLKHVSGLFLFTGEMKLNLPDPDADTIRLTWWEIFRLKKHMRRCARYCREGDRQARNRMIASQIDSA